MTLRIEDLLRSLVAKGASDLHVKAGSAPGFRIDGEIQPLTAVPREERPPVAGLLARPLRAERESLD